MPEGPEVETVKEMLKKRILKRRITNVKLYYDKVIAYPDKDNFIKQIIDQTFIDIKRRGKYLLFELNDYYLVSHLRMEGKYFFKTEQDELNKHEHIALILDNGLELRYHDTRKFGRLSLIPKDQLMELKELKKLGVEPFDSELTVKYLKNIYQKKKLAIKSTLLDQTIITGIGNIYADEILFLSKINPEKPANKLTNKEIEKIIENTRVVLAKAIEKGGTTVHTYAAVDGISGLFQTELKVHMRKGEKCLNCGTEIIKIKVNGRGTYYCPKCQKR